MVNTNIVCRKLIKPGTPTPQNLRSYKLSLLDDLASRMEVGVLLFYPSKPETISQLEESLSKILVQFYPLAGRYIEKGHFFDCSDQGAEFVEAEGIDVELIDVVDKMTTFEQLNGFLPCKNHQVDEAVDPLLSVQITELKCGGLVIGISVSHRIFDASSLGTFVAAWSNASNPGPGGKITICPSFESSLLFPCKNQNRNNYPDVKPAANGAPPSPPPPPPPPMTVCKRFSFNKEAITTLRSKLIPNVDGKRRISRVRVVCAFISKALMGMEREKYGQQSRCSLIAQAINLRGRTIPPLPKHSCGNLALISLTPCMAASETKDMGIQELVRILGGAIDKSIADCGEILSLSNHDLDNIIVDPVVNAFEKSVSGETNVIWFSDWSKFGFYEADFGWGKPVWASIPPLPVENLTILMDNKEGNGIEAWVQLNYMDMSVFEQDEEIRSFAN